MNHIDILSIGIENKKQIKNKIIFDLSEIPTPTMIYLLALEEAYVNKLASEKLGMKGGDYFDVHKWKEINPQLDEMINRVNNDSFANFRAIMTLFNGKKEIVNLNVSLIKNNTLGDIHFIQFSQVSDQYIMSSIAELYTVKDEILKLRPYLNSAGKMLQENIMKKYFFEEDQKFVFNDMVYYEKELKIIQKIFPALSQFEVIMCGLLVHGLSSQDISTITRRSLNSIFVAIHRINKKLNFKDKKDLIKRLQVLIEIEIANETN